MKTTKSRDCSSFTQTTKAEFKTKQYSLDKKHNNEVNTYGLPIKTFDYSKIYPWYNPRYSIGTEVIYPIDDHFTYTDFREVNFKKAEMPAQMEIEYPKPAPTLPNTTKNNTIVQKEQAHQTTKAENPKDDTEVVATGEIVPIVNEEIQLVNPGPYAVDPVDIEPPTYSNIVPTTPGLVKYTPQPFGKF